MKINKTTFHVDKSALTNMSSQTTSEAVTLIDGQVLLAVDRFSFTANNVTYATLGATLRYWNFFPAGDLSQGIIPVWGFADVIATACDGIALGHRFYGYYPMASHLIVEPSNLSPHGFVDATHHRRSLPKIYNQYTNTATDPLYRQDAEALQMLMRPLFTTAFLLADFFEESEYFGAEQLVLSSASSKTAIGTAMLLKDSQSSRPKPIKIVGLTSQANREFVQKLGCYDQVLCYHELPVLEANIASAVIDFSGNGKLLTEIAQLITSNLRYVCLVGVSHWDQRQGLEAPGIGPKPVLFFAPTQAEKRLSEWTVAGFHQRLAKAWSQFEFFAQPWLGFEVHKGVEKIEAMYQRVLQGKQAPDTGCICSFKLT